MSLDTEIAFSADTLHNYETITSWTNTIGLALERNLSPDCWIEFVLSLVTGKRGDETSTLYTFKRLVLGGYANGMSVVSEMALNPSARQKSLIRMHVKRGHLLNIPLSDHGLVMVSALHLSQSELQLHEDGKLKTLNFDPKYKPASDVRVDAEPCWEGNPRELAFRVRCHGVIRSMINLNSMFHHLSAAWVPCTCAAPVTKLGIPLTDKWHQVSFQHILEWPSGQAMVYDTDRILVDCSGSESALMAVVGILKCRRIFITRGCLQCAYAKCEAGNMQEGIAIVIGPCSIS